MTDTWNGNALMPDGTRDIVIALSRDFNYLSETVQRNAAEASEHRNIIAKKLDCIEKKFDKINNATQQAIGAKKLAKAALGVGLAIGAAGISKVMAVMGMLR